MRPVVRRALTLSLLLALGPMPRVESAVVMIPSSRDNTLFQDTEGDTSNGAGPAFFAGRNAQNLTRRALVAFDLSGIPSGAQIDAVELALEVTSAPDTVHRLFTLHRVLADWGEGLSSSSGGSGAPATPGDATWLHAFYPDHFWSSPGGDFEPSASGDEMVGDVGAYVWTGPGLVADVRTWLSHPDSNFGWLIRGEESGPRSVRRFDSRESPQQLNRPTLSIHYFLPVATRPASWGALKALYR